MKSQATRILVSLLFCSAAYAGADRPIVQLEGQSKKVGGVIVSKAGKVDIDNRHYDGLVVVGAGERDKYGLNAYVGELLVPAGDNGANIKKYKATVTENNILNFVSNQPVAALVMHIRFLTGVDGTLMAASFDEALIANRDPKVKVIPSAAEDKQLDADIREFHDKVMASGAAPRGSTLRLVWERRDNGDEVVSYQNENGAPIVVHGHKGFARSVLAFWLGVPSDSGLSALKKAFVNWKGNLK